MKKTLGRRVAQLEEEVAKIIAAQRAVNAAGLAPDGGAQALALPLLGPHQPAAGAVVDVAAMQVQAIARAQAQDPASGARAAAAAAVAKSVRSGRKDARSDAAIDARSTRSTSAAASAAAKRKHEAAAPFPSKRTGSSCSVGGGATGTRRGDKAAAAAKPKPNLTHGPVLVLTTPQGAPGGAKHHVVVKLFDGMGSAARGQNNKIEPWQMQNMLDDETPHIVSGKPKYYASRSMATIKAKAAEYAPPSEDPDAPTIVWVPPALEHWYE